MNAPSNKGPPPDIVCLGAPAFNSGFGVIRLGGLFWVVFNNCFSEQLSNNFAVSMLLNLNLMARSFWGCFIAHTNYTHWLPLHFLLQLLWKQRGVGHCGRVQFSEIALAVFLIPMRLCLSPTRRWRPVPFPLWIWAEGSNRLVTTECWCHVVRRPSPNESQLRAITSEMCLYLEAQPSSHLSSCRNKDIS